MSGTAEPAVEEITAALESFLRDALGDAAAPVVTGLHRSGSGSSRENWPFDAEWNDRGERARHRLLMRRDPPAAVVDTGRDMEFRLLRRLAATAVPAPRVLWLDDTGERLMRPTMIVERHPGEAHRAVLRDADPLGLGDKGRLALAERLCEVLAELHRVDVDATGIGEELEDPGENPARHELTRWERELDAHELEPQPGLRLAAAWLRDNLPEPPARTVLVHGDFRPANVLVHDGALSVLLDWELAHLGDPVDDLGWYTAPVYRREHFQPGWEPDDFLRRYTELTGIEVDPRALAFWQVLSMFRLAVIALTGIRAFCGGSDRPAAPADALIRQVLAAVPAAEGA
ncbi:phosphotransferase [Actinomadura sp. LD22]|uniref:Phosphotransferase n=1 Tax=Actinomadura physcomitrii TaxID=2650748 RepID=A0A6I4MC10_9ACTN|nr:phosphotransferase family protein [Actinomadura physcomitrii]MWA03243.1 phosphotransferase [Actinomadura physcomitrii]